MTKKSVTPKRVVSKRKILTLFVVVMMLVFSASIFPADQKSDSSSDKSNGCGTKDFKVPDKPLGNDFKSSCDYHDKCYSTPGKSKSDCDTNFKKDMGDVCKEKKGLDRVGCEVSKFIYHTGVKLGGNDAYNKAQGKDRKEEKNIIPLLPFLPCRFPREFLTGRNPYAVSGAPIHGQP
jgi:hypothetical protein